MELSSKRGHQRGESLTPTRSRLLHLPSFFVVALQADQLLHLGVLSVQQQLSHQRRIRRVFTVRIQRRSHRAVELAVAGQGQDRGGHLDPGAELQLLPPVFPEPGPLRLPGPGLWPSSLPGPSSQLGPSSLRSSPPRCCNH